ncbi:MAG: host-nuclease inhibitor Gam family protein [Alphaproteobacteria bacterium]|nr:host-nuclease inhibitor Gam family protein [Alphaproteobacteria bacterium]
MAKVKQPAATVVCQSRQETMTAITDLGNTQRELTRLTTELNDRVAQINEEFAPRIEALKLRAEIQTKQIQGWCEANRFELCGKDTKTANMITGTVSWRFNPPSVSVPTTGWAKDSPVVKILGPLAAEAFRQVYSGNSVYIQNMKTVKNHLKARELKALGKSNRDIANEMNLSVRHIKRLVGGINFITTRS